MLASQKHLVRASEIKSRLNALANADSPSAEDAVEVDRLRGELTATEAQYRAAVAVEDTGNVSNSPEGREFADLERRASVGNIVDGIIQHRAADGAEDELQKALGIAPNQIPLALLRTRAVTPAPTNVGTEQNAIIPYVFPASAAAFLGISMPTVGVGEQVYLVLTSALSVEALAENAAGSETDGVFAAEVLSPGRLQAAFFYSREDRARFAGMDSALRQNLSDGLADGLDKAILSAATGGLIGTGLTVRAGDAGALATFADYRGMVYDADTIDGRFAADAAALRVLMSPGGYGHAASIYRANNADDSAIDSLMRVSGGVRVSPHLTVAGDDQPVIVRKGMAMDAVAPVWEGVTIINDEVTKADNGQVKLTAVLLYAFKVLRTDGFQRRAVQIA